MIHHPSRRDILKTTAKLAVAGSLAGDVAAIAHAEEPKGFGVGTLSQVDAMLRVATTAGEVPGVVALAATDKGIVYEGIYGRRRIDGGPAMARDTVFRVACWARRDNCLLRARNRQLRSRPRAAATARQSLILPHRASQPQQVRGGGIYSTGPDYLA